MDRGGCRDFIAGADEAARTLRAARRPRAAAHLSFVAATVVFGAHDTSFTARHSGLRDNWQRCIRAARPDNQQKKQDLDHL
jgi:hypothetical protein